MPPAAGDALAYIDLYNGPPETPADLALDDTKMTGGITSNFWHLRAGPEGLSINAATAEGPYSRMETIRLPDMVKTCRADFKPGRKVNDLTLQKFSCR